jgi:hypothetical protein
MYDNWSFRNNSRIHIAICPKCLNRASNSRNIVSFGSDHSMKWDATCRTQEARHTLGRVDRKHNWARPTSYPKVLESADAPRAQSAKANNWPLASVIRGVMENER